MPTLTTKTKLLFSVLLQVPSHCSELLSLRAIIGDSQAELETRNPNSRTRSSSYFLYAPLMFYFAQETFLSWKADLSLALH